MYGALANLKYKKHASHANHFCQKKQTFFIIFKMSYSIEQIQNITLKSLVWSSMNQTSLFKMLKTHYFQLWFLYIATAQSTAEKHKEIIKIKHQKNNNIFYIIYQIKMFKGTVGNLTLLSLQGGSLGNYAYSPFKCKIIPVNVSRIHS